MRLIDADYIIEKETNTLRTLSKNTLQELIEHIGVDDEYIIYATGLQSYANEKMMLTYLRSVLKNAPTVDEIVRCKDCKWRETQGCYMVHVEYNPDGTSYLNDMTDDDGFCDRGKRRTGE